MPVTVSILKSDAVAIKAGNCAPSLVAAIMGAAIAAQENANRTVIKANGTVQDCGPTAKGVAWFSYAKLVSLRKTREYGALANGRFLPITDTGAIVPGKSWKGSTVMTVNHTAINRVGR